MKTRKPKSPTKKERASVKDTLEQVMWAAYTSGADGSLLSRLVSKCCSGMNEGDRFYDASHDSWWEWRGGELRGSGPPRGYGKTPTRGRR